MSLQKQREHLRDHALPLPRAKCTNIADPTVGMRRRARDADADYSSTQAGSCVADVSCQGAQPPRGALLAVPCHPGRSPSRKDLARGSGLEGGGGLERGLSQHHAEHSGFITDVSNLSMIFESNGASNAGGMHVPASTIRLAKVASAFCTKPWHVGLDPGNSGAGTKRDSGLAPGPDPDDGEEQAVGGRSVARRTLVSFEGWCMHESCRNFSSKARLEAESPNLISQGALDAVAASACAGVPRASQDVRGSRASNQLRKQGSRMLSKASIRMSMAGGSRPRGTRDQGGYQEEHKVGLPTVLVD